MLENMPKAYTVTSDPFFVNGNLTETTPGTFAQQEISLPLDSLNREGVIVHACYFSGDEPERLVNQMSRIRMQVTATSKTSIVGANDANLISRQEKYVLGGAAEFSGPHVIDVIASNEPYQESDNLGLIATDNVFLGIQSTNQSAGKAAQVRLVCSRIKLSADAYAALVTNELSS